MTYLFIFFARVCDVTLATMRTILVVQGRKVPAAVLGFFEIIIYVLALNTVMSNMDNILNVIAYGLGFAAGNYVGIAIEDRLALGTISTQIIVPIESRCDVLEALYDRGFGATSVAGHGYERESAILIAVINRRDYRKLNYIVKKIEPSSFITVNSVTKWTGGFFKK